MPGPTSPFLLNGGRVGDGGEFAALLGDLRMAPSPLSPPLRISGHTTTQPSSIEEEGF
jgi:hypothetical protein